MTENFDLDALKKGDDVSQGGGAGAGDAGGTGGGDGAASSNKPSNTDAGKAGEAAAGAEGGDKGKAGGEAGVAAGDAGAAAGGTGAAAGDGGAEGAGAADAGKAGAAPAADAGKPTPTAEELKKTATEELLKQAGVSSVQELMDRLKPKVELTEEQKKEAAAKYEVNLNKYAVENKVMTLDEINALNNALAATDEQLAFAQYEAKFREAKKDATPEEVRQGFNLFYHVEATDESLKNAGAQAIKERADAVRNALSDKKNVAKEAFDDHARRSSMIPGYKQTIQSAIKEYVPEQLEFPSGDGDDKVVFKLTDPKLKVELEKFLVGEETFDEYMKEPGSQQVKTLLKDKIEGYLLLRNKDLIIKSAYDAGIQKGRKSGSNAGATNSFAMNGNGAGKPVEVDGDETNLTQNERDKLGVLFGGH